MRAAALSVLVAVGIVASGCGGSRTSAGTTTPTVTTASPLAYSHCMRTHGVPAFPDPTAGGQISKPQVVAVRKADPSQFDSADHACRALLPPGGNGETPAQIAQDWRQFRQFAACMRRNGVPNWPDPTARSTTDRRPAFAITALGLNGNSPQLRAKAQQCASQVHLDGLPAAH
ncbi:MAG TPA: hypothetical protein VMH47_04185 [Gaiellaceae bacterium]|nr:hypothetical protein [Gaiellaceae bacterium]